MEKEFNLIDEPWIRVRTADCSAKEVSLRDAILSSHEYTELAGETKAQDTATLRLLLAVIYTVFSRCDSDGNEVDLTDDVDFPVDNWGKMWHEGRFPEKPFEIYFEEWHDRFWLFGDEHPFYQSTAAKGHGKPYEASKMIGTLFESGNKPRLFAERSCENRSLGFAEAARWLVHLICFDDIAAKKPTPKRTWTGKLSLIAIKGNNLFETFMLNYVANADVSNGIYESKPSWEADNNDDTNRLIPVPDNQAELLTLPLRNVYLCRKGNTIDGYYLSGGAYFEENDVFIEQMTLWRGKQEKKNGPIRYKPKLFNNTELLWQEFGNIAVAASNNEDSPDSGKRRAGVLVWIDCLLEDGILPENYFVNIMTAAVLYNESQTTCLNVVDTISDGLSFHSRLLLEAGEKWRIRVNEEIEKCDKAAKSVWALSVGLQKAEGASGDGVKGDKEKAQYYSVIDHPFREWLAKLSPDYDLDDYCRVLEKRLKKLTLDFGKKLVTRTGESAILGRFVKIKEKTECISASGEFGKFSGAINKIFNLAGDER